MAYMLEALTTVNVERQASITAVTAAGRSAWSYEKMQSGRGSWLKSFFIEHSPSERALND